MSMMKRMGIIFDSELPPLQKLVLLALVDNYSRTVRVVINFFKILSEKTSICEQDLRDILRQLLESGFLLNVMDIDIDILLNECIQDNEFLINF